MLHHLSRAKLQQFKDAEHEQQERIARAWDRYNGEFPDALKPTKSDPKGEDNVKFNLCRLVVQKGVSFLFGFDLGFQVDRKAGEKKASPAETWLSDCWDANRRMTTLHKAGINGGITGHCFLRLHAPNPARNGHPYPRIVVWDTASVSVRWSPEDIDDVVRYVYSWHGIDPQTSRPQAYRQVIERTGSHWEIRDEVSRLPLLPGGTENGAWEVQRTEAWPYPWAPVFHCQNLVAPNEFWGRPDLEEDLIDTNEDLNFTGSNINRILRGYAHPRTWGRGFGKGDIELGPDNIAILPSGHGGNPPELQTLETASDLSSSLSWFSELRQAFHEIARMPEVATGKVQDLGQLSGLALQILYGPLVELTKTKRLTYGEMLELLNKRLLELGKQTGKKVAAQWPPVLPTDTKGEAEEAVTLNELGVSKDTLLTRLGFDAEEEAKKKQKEDQAAAELGAALLKDFDRGGKPDPEDTGDDDEDGQQ